MNNLVFNTVTVQALIQHVNNAAVVEPALHFIAIISTDMNTRAKYGTETPCCGAIVKALEIHSNHPDVVNLFLEDYSLLCIVIFNFIIIFFFRKVLYGCNALVTVATGNVFNRGLFGKAGACEQVKALLLKYQGSVQVAPMVCRAVFILASGSNEHRAKFAGLQQPIQQIINSKEFSDVAKKDAKDALRVVQ